MRKALLPMIASLALCGAATGALIATTARAAQPAKKPVMMVSTPSLGGAPAPMAPPGGLMMDAPGDMSGPPMPGPMGGKMGERMKAHLDQMCKDMYARKVGELAFVETKLSLTPAQAPLFARWKQVSLDIAQHHNGACDTRIAKFEARKAGERPGMIDRLAREEEMLKNRLADIQAERPALEALYKALTPDQQRELNRPGMGGHPMMGRMMMGMMPRPGMGPMGGPPGMGPMGPGPMGPPGMGPMGGPPGMGPMGPHGPADVPPPPPPQ